MGWMGWVLGLLAAWVVGEVVGSYTGGLVVLGGLVGWMISRLHERLTRTEQQVQEELKSVREQLRMALSEGPLQRELSSLRKEVAALQQQAVAPVVSPPETQAPPTEPATAAKPPATEATLAVATATTATRQAPTAPMAPANRPPAADADTTRPAPTGDALARSSAPAANPSTPAQRPLAPTETDEKSLQVTGSLGASLRAWFTGGNTIVRVAVLILFIGVAFLLRYAAERTTVPIELRLMGIAAAGVVLVALGRRLLLRRRGYALSLQGAGVGMVYLTLFAAYRLYGLLPAGLAFGLLGLMAAITAVLAVGQNALPLAVLGFGGAFLAPVLTSSGQGNHVGLFGYCLLLNLAIAWIAQRQAWKLLNVVGFVFTFTLAGAWGTRAYRPEHFWTTEPFLIAHFLLYLFIAVQYTRNILKADPASGPAVPAVDGSLLFGVPIVAFGLQAALLKDQPLALAASAAVLSAIYLVVGRWLWQASGQRVRVLVEGLLALGVIFMALVVPLALDARWTAAAWAIQGAGVLWVGLRQRRWWAAGMGLLLQGGAALTFWSAVPSRHSGWAVDAVALPMGTQGLTPFLNAEFFGVLVLAGAALVSARWLVRQTQDVAPDTPHTVTAAFHALHPWVMGLGVLQLWWFGWLEWAAWPQSTLSKAWLGAAWSALLAVVFELAQRPLRWPELRWAACALMGMAWLVSTAGLFQHWGAVATSWAHLTVGWGWLEVGGLTALGLWLLHRQQDRDATHWQTAQGVALAWYAMLHSGWLLYSACAYWVARHEGWTPTAAILLPTLIALALVARAASQRFPVGPQALAYRRFVLQPWQALLAVWVLAVNAFSDAGMAPLPYLPLLNPIDLAHGLILVYSLRLSRLGTVSGATTTPGSGTAVVAALAFWWLNGLLIRTLHHWADTPMWDRGALDSALVQTSLSVLWTLSALVTMLYATRKATGETARRLWMVGAALLAVVVLKLFVVDLSNVGTLPRIVSFMAVGVLMLVIGYVSPMPPAAAPGRSASNP